MAPEIDHNTLDDKSADDKSANGNPTDDNRTDDNPTDSNSKDDNSTDDSLPPSAVPWMQYSAEWFDDEGKLKSRTVVSADSESKLPKPEAGTASSPAFEIVSIFHTNARTDNPTYRMRIFSVAIVHALRSVVKYYPQQNLAGDVIRIQWPYPILVHHYNELRTFARNCAEKDGSDVCVRERNANEAVTLLLGYLDKEVMGPVHAEMEQNARGYFTFDYHWVLHKPGTVTMSRTKENMEWTIFIIRSVTGGIFSGERARWWIDGWRLQSDGTQLGRVQESVFTGIFDGEHSYERCDMILLNEDDFSGDVGLRGDYLGNNPVVKQRIAEGKAYWKLMLPQCRYYDGMTAKFPNISVRALVMADLKTYYEQTSVVQPQFMDESDLRVFISDCHCQVCKTRGTVQAIDRASIFDEYDEYITSLLDDRAAELWDSQFLLCPTKLPVFVFGMRSWETVYVRNLSEPVFQRKMIDSLVVDERRRKTLTSLTESFARLNVHGKALPQDPWKADFVEQKGNGLIFLLHGGPGVGKTFTAECVAHALERPLLVLRIADIGTYPEAVEKRLMGHFKTAKSWNAVVLIDEADVFLAQRKIEDLQRSSLVASFLRVLEFYDGLLFLTTNRVGTFDDAILSRVHVQLYYPDLDEDQRQTMWKTFIKKLEADRPNMQVKYALKEYLRSSEMRKFKMNGREIRNAFQTAVALAEHRAEEGEDGKILLTEEHLREIVELNRSFKTYFSDLHGSEGRRAENRGERLDSFIKAIQDRF